MKTFLISFIWIGLLTLGCYGKIHTLSIVEDERPIIVLSSFGFLKGGYLKVNITNLKISRKNNQAVLGFSFDKSSSSGSSSYVEREETTNKHCALDDDGKDSNIDDIPRALMKIEPKDDKFTGYKLSIKTRLLKGLQFYATEDALRKTPDEPSESDVNIDETTMSIDVTDAIPTTPSLNNTKDGTNNKLIEEGTKVKNNENNSKETEAANNEKKKDDSNPQSRKKRTPVEDDENSPGLFVDQGSIPIQGYYDSGMHIVFYTKIETNDQIGLYELYFHNCETPVNSNSPKDQPLKASFLAHVTEKNGESYLSAGDMALPLMYGITSLMFFAVGVVWIQVICSTKETVFKIHYLMAVIIIVKGSSVMFHSLDYYFIAKDGRTEAWAVIFYIVHLLKGILLIICLLLIGTGWAFIKYILSDRDKKLFMIVIPMQVMVNVAYIIMEETEEGNKSYYTWKNIVILVDILCCGAILIPVVWSIRHLQAASQTDGKAAINLAKLQLFRHFYVMVVCYLYFTRIIVYLLEITLPFQYIWIHAFFSEIGAFVFFTVTGYKFRPGCDNPYLKLEQYDSDEDPEEAITRSGALENITRVNQKTKEEDETDEFDVLLPKQRTTTKV